MTDIDRQPSYLEEDSPAKKGAKRLLQPPRNMLEIPGREINSAVLNKVPATPRSKKILKEMSRTNDDEEAVQLTERYRKINTSLRLRKVEEAREKQVKENRQAMAPQRFSTKKTNKRQAHYMEKSNRNSFGSATSATAKQYLQSRDSSRGSTSYATKLVDDKLEFIRDEVAGGLQSLDQLRKHNHSKPKGPKPSVTREKVVQVDHKSPQEIAQEREEAMLKWRTSHIYRGALAAYFVIGVNKIFQRMVLVHRYKESPEAMGNIVRLQRWSRHVRLKYIFKTLMVKRRVVYKAVGWWMMGARLRYRALCQKRILSFFRACFEQSGFRMAMKIFTFRVVKVQRTIRDFLSCHRARIAVLCMRLKVEANNLDNSRHALEISRCARYVAEHKSYAVNSIVKKYRRPFIAQRAEYLRAIKLGDLTPAFQEVDLTKIKRFLRGSTLGRGDDQPPQYAGDKIKRPFLQLFTRVFLCEDFLEVVKGSLPSFHAHERRLAEAEAERREQRALDAATARGEGQAYQLMLIQKRMEESGDPHERFESGKQELYAFFRKRREAEEAKRREDLSKRDYAGNR